MSGTQRNPAEDQSALWNGAAGESWVESQELLDRMFEPFAKLLAEAARDASPSRVLDVGCGTGATTLAVAQVLGADARSVGVDISAPMIAAARVRAERESSTTRFICADAQTHAFEPATVDLIVSRFGVMFFDDSVRAFTNLRHAARDGADLRLIVWRGPEHNAFMTAAERAAAPLLPNIPPRVADAPGQFGFANRDRVRRILEQSGWGEIDIQPIDVACIFPASELMRYVTRIGPIGRLLRDADEGTRARVLAAVLSAFDAYVHGDEVRFDAGCWTVGARAAAA